MKQHTGWKHPGRRSSDYSLSQDHDHDRRNYLAPKGYNRDRKIYDEVCERLKWNPDVDATNIEVNVRDNCIYLEGYVDSRHAKKMAEHIAEEIIGVVDIFNFLEIRNTLDIDSDKIIARGDDGLFTAESFKDY